MMKYLAARPETISSIVKFGHLPLQLPDYLKESQLVLFDMPHQAAGSLKTNFDQVFIIEIDIATITPHEIFKMKASAAFIATESIRKIICYSERGNKLLANLLKNILHPVIEINSSVFTVSQSNNKRAITDAATMPAFKEIRLSNEGGSLTSSGSTLYFTLPQLLKRLASPNEHIALLRNSLEKATKTILITSYDISHKSLQSMDFYLYLAQAVSRGVRVYIYYNDSKGADEAALKELVKLGPLVSCGEAYTHSKLLCVDNQTVSIGSYNWLSFHPKSRMEEKTEGTFVSYHRDLNKKLLEDIWSHLRVYRNIQFGNYTAVDRFDSNEDNNSTLQYALDQHTDLEYIPTLDQHCGFLQDDLKEAKRKIVICSPFLSMKQFLEDINVELLRSMLQKGIAIVFVTSSNNEYTKLYSYFQSVGCEGIHLIGYDDFHLKTLIIDDNIIAEGSFNWFSAMRNENSEHHNHEATLLVRGRAAVGLIDEFYQSPVGQLVSMVSAAFESQCKK